MASMNVCCLMMLCTFVALLTLSAIITIIPTITKLNLPNATDIIRQTAGTRRNIFLQMRDRFPQRCIQHQDPSRKLLQITYQDKTFTQLPKSFPLFTILGRSLRHDYDVCNVNFVDDHIVDMGGTHNLLEYYTQTKLVCFNSNNMELPLQSMTDLMKLSKVQEMCYINRDYLDYLDKVDKSPFRELPVQGNQSQCDCNVKQSPRSLESNQSSNVFGVPNTECRVPKRTHVKKVLQQNESGRLYEGDVITDMSGLHVCAPMSVVVVMIIVIITVIASCVGLLYRQLLFRFFRWQSFDLKDCNSEEESLFDVFLVYAEHDKDYAIQELLPWLKAHNYKVAKRCTSLKYNPNIANNIIHCVDASKRTLVVLSDCFVKSDWCHTAFFMALTIDHKSQRKHLIGIVIEEISQERCAERFIKFSKESKRCLRKNDPALHAKLCCMLAPQKIGEFPQHHKHLKTLGKLAKLAGEGSPNNGLHSSQKNSQRRNGKEVLQKILTSSRGAEELKQDYLSYAVTCDLQKAEAIWKAPCSGYSTECFGLDTVD